MSSVRPLISEIYGPVIQGEGPRAGEPTIFVRTGGCDYRCSWCDSMHAVDPANRDKWTLMEQTDIADRVSELSEERRPMVTLSGGNPAMWDLGALVLMLRARGHGVAIETQGTVFAPWVQMLTQVVVSPKPPSSGMVTDWAQLRKWLLGAPNVALKVVVSALDDDLTYLAEVRSFARLVGHEGPIWCQPCGPLEKGEDPNWVIVNAVRRYSDLCSDVIDLGWNDVRVLPQLHVLTSGGGPGV